MIRWSGNLKCLSALQQPPNFCLICASRVPIDLCVSRTFSSKHIVVHVKILPSLRYDEPHVLKCFSDLMQERPCGTSFSMPWPDPCSCSGCQQAQKLNNFCGIVSVCRASICETYPPGRGESSAALNAGLEITNAAADTQTHIHTHTCAINCVMVLCSLLSDLSSGCVRRISYRVPNLCLNGARL